VKKNHVSSFNDCAFVLVLVGDMNNKHDKFKHEHKCDSKHEHEHEMDSNMVTTTDVNTTTVKPWNTPMPERCSSKKE
jgi:ABC-type Zn2+ transport system substrate-binding protein/surface adhesin